VCRVPRFEIIFHFKVKTFLSSVSLLLLTIGILYLRQKRSLSYLYFVKDLGIDKKAAAKTFWKISMKQW